MSAQASTYLLPCTQLMHQFFFCLDQFDYEKLVGLFEADGIFYHQGERLSGRADIMRAMTDRSPTQRIRHVISNVFIDSETAGTANVVAYMTAYRFDDGQLHTGPVAIGGPLRLSVVRACMRSSGSDWKIAEMGFAAEFDFPTGKA
jgi:SnoaL-like domain